MLIKKLTLLFVIVCSCLQMATAQNIPTPKEHFGFNIGDNYQLTTFIQTEAYFKKLAQASDRAKYTVIGKTEEGRDQFMMIVSSPENLKKLEEYKRISQRMGNADISAEEAKIFAKTGKAVVWIDGGLHATETAGIHQLIETAYQLISRTDEETMRILNDVIILITHANPDGQELVSNWYMREPKPEKRSLANLPRLYEKYAGHDNNRDFYMLNLKESQNIARQLFVEWLPQIMYNHHQAGPAGSVVAGPPYRDPFNYVFDPLIITGLDAIGAAMQNRLNEENKSGFTSKAGSVFSTWYNGGLRTTTYFHNMVGLLTEIVGSPNPSTIPLVTNRLIPNAATPNPIVPQPWLFRQTIDYSVSLNYAVLNYASRYKDELLMNIYRMGRNAIEKGNKDNWTLSPSKIAAIDKLQQDSLKRVRPGNEANRNAAATVPLKFYDSVMKNAAFKDPRGYIIPADQPDIATAVEFLNALIKTGIVVQKATTDFTVAGKKYPANSYIVKTNQAFRPHVLDMFEPQDHPNDFQYPGGPPVPPYDAAGWTLAYQMGIQFDRIMDGFDGPFITNPLGEIIKLSGAVVKNAAAGYILDARANQSFKAINNLVNAAVDVYRINDVPAGSAYSNGSFFVASNAKSRSALDKAVAETNANFIAADKKPAALTKIKKARIALWDTYGGSMPSGWVRLIMEKFNYSFDVIYPKDIDSGDLRSKYDVVLFVDDGIPAINSRNTQNNRSSNALDSIPEGLKRMTGRITVEKSIPQLKMFLEQGGNIVTIGSSTQLAYHLKLPVADAMVEIVNGEEKALVRDKFYTPGSILRMQVDNNQPATSGLNNEIDVYFDNNPVFKLNPDAVSSGIIKPLAWFGTGKILRSGWSWGEAYLKNGVIAFEASVGKGKLYAFSPEITFRAQAWGTFKLLFNQLYVK